MSLGTGLILIIGSAPPVRADDTTTSPSASASGTTSSNDPSVDPSEPPPPPKPVLYVDINRTSKAAVHAGNTVPLVARVHVKETPSKDVRLTLGTNYGSISVECTHLAGLCKLGDVTTTGQKVDFKLTVPSTMDPGTITITGLAFSPTDNVQSLVKQVTIKVTKKPEAKSSHSGGSNSSGNGSGSKAGSGSGSQVPSGLGNVGSSTGTTPSTAPRNTSMLPPIGQQPSQTQSPTTVPLVETAGNAQSMRGAAEGPQELTFDELASTQAAWLAALLVAFSLLLTQIRLGKATSRTAKAIHAKGAHRKIWRQARRPRVL